VSDGLKGHGILQLSSAIKVLVERCADDLRDNSALGQIAKQGKLSARSVAVYLESLRYLFWHSERNLQLAAERARQCRDQTLNEYFASKAREERGHDGWAQNDLERLPDTVKSRLEPADAIIELVALQRRLIEQHPVCFVVYAFWAEYFTALIGDDWLSWLQASGFERAQISAIAKHLDADRGHAERGLEAIDELWHGTPDAATMLSIVNEAGAIFSTFCDEVCLETTRALAAQS
jgi:hypothetical protein